MKYRVIKDKDGNITECHALGLKGIPTLQDENGFWLYKYDEEKDEFVQLPETPEMVERKKEAEIVRRIKFSPRAEYIRLAGTDEEKAKYKIDIEKIKTEIDQDVCW